MVMKSKISANTHRNANISDTAILQTNVNRMVLRTELETTRTAFHDFLLAISDEKWRQKSPVCDWTMAEVALHITWSLEQLPQEISSAKRGEGMFNSPKSFDWLTNKLSYWMIRWMARKVTPEVIRRRYDAAMSVVLRTLDEVNESDWMLGASFYGHGFYSVADLFHTPSEHFIEHSVIK